LTTTSGSHLLLGLDGEGGMGYKPETLLRYQVTGNTAEAIGLVSDTHKCIFQMPDELLLTSGECFMFFPAQGLLTFFKITETLVWITVFSLEILYQKCIIPARLFQLGVDELAEFLGA
jgi:hypothetical protein